MLRSGALHELAKPVPVAMIDGQCTEATKLVTFSIGVANYAADLLVIPMAEQGCVLGAVFISFFDVSKQCGSKKFRLGVRMADVLPCAAQKWPYQAYHAVPMQCARGYLPLHLK